MGPAEQVYLAVQHTARVFRGLDTELGLSPARFSVLATLRYQGPQRVGALARLEDVAQPTITRLVVALEREGLVERHADPGDRRGSVVRLTAEGRALVRRARSRKIAWIERALRDLKPADIAAAERAARHLDTAASVRDD
jgi:DNA-binding MarR family transcriptional regulator